MKSKDGIIGMAVGEAMGVPLSQVEREKLLENPVLEMREYGSFNKPVGTWSSDTSLALATIDSLNNCFGISVEDIASRFCQWMEKSEYTANDDRFDIGRTTMIALSRFEKNRDASECGSMADDSNENDCLSRMIPIAYYCYTSKLGPAEVYETVKKVASISHAHEISVLGCYILVVYAMKLMERKSKFDAYQELKKANFSYFSRSSLEKYVRVIRKNIYELPMEAINSGSSIVETIEAVFWVFLNTSTFNQAIIGGINLGGDTSTIGAILGALAGISFGVKSINPEWRIDLKRYTYISRMCARFDESLYPPEKRLRKPEPILGREDKIIKIILGDITKLNVDTYVNAANNSLLGGSGVDGAIHEACGPELLEKCRQLEGCETGEAKITLGYNSKADYIIHTVAPKWYDASEKNREELLKKCYESSICLAEDFDCKRIAFPCLGMGAYGCPLEIGGKIAVDFAIAQARRRDLKIENIYLVCFDNELYEFYLQYYNEAKYR